MQRRRIAGRVGTALVGVWSFVSPALATAAAEVRPGGLARRAFFGVEIRPATADERAKQRLEEEHAVLVERVLPDSSAAAADVRPGDLLLALDGKGIANPSRLIEALSASRAGDRVTIALARDGAKVTKTVALQPRPYETSDGWRVIYGSVVSRGKRLRTIVTRPKDDRRHPALFLIQGLGSFSVENAPGGAGPYARIIGDFAGRGFVTMRVDKPGQGDSEGGPTQDIDFETELDGYRQALRALKALDFVDPGNVIIFGHSMGGVMGPLLAAEDPVKGIAVYGTVARTWHEYTLENVRRQQALGGFGFAEIDRTVRKDVAIDHFLMEGLSPSEIAARHPELKGRIDDWYADGKHHAATHYAYFRQLAGQNLAEAWEKFGGHALAVWGKADFISGEEDHALIARIVNRTRPGRAVFLALDGIDHAFCRASSQEESFKDFRKPGREFNPAFLVALRDWTTKVWSVDVPAGASDKQPKKP
jgi:pimeloyl-ACP methyl ester carboxylesterase